MSSSDPDDSAEPLTPVVDPVLPPRPVPKCRRRYPVSRYCNGSSRLPSQISLSHSLHRSRRDLLVHRIVEAARQGQIGLMLRLFRPFLENYAHCGSLAAYAEVTAAWVDFIDLVIFKSTAPDNRVRSEIRKRLYEKVHIGQMALYSRRAEYRTWPEKLDLSTQDGQVNTFLETQDDHDSLAEDSVTESF